MDEANPNNHLVFSFDIDLGSSILQLTDAPEAPLEIRKMSINFSEEPPLTTSVWKMFFDGAYSKEGVGARVIFVSPTQETISLSYKLEFKTTNNVAEYETLVLGLRAAKDIGIEELLVFGDAKLIVHQIKNLHQTKHPRLRSYTNEVWDLVDSFFSTFNISLIPREENIVYDSLVVSASNFRIPIPPKIKYGVEVKYMPSMPDNVKYWKVFEDDLELKNFLETIDEFSALHINQDHDPEITPHANVFLNKISNHHIVQLPRNHIPKGIVPFEILFDGNDVALKGKVSIDDADITECNVGTVKDTKYIKLSSNLSEKKREEYTKLLKEFADVFASNYEDIITYDISIIEHKIPSKENTKPLKKKLRQINPMLIPVMEKKVKKILDEKIIIPLRYSECVANLVPVRKKNGEISLCVDFQNLNRSSKKDNYPLQYGAHITEGDRINHNVYG
jgi:ribonuclease HI